MCTQFATIMFYMVRINSVDSIYFHWLNLTDKSNMKLFGFGGIAWRKIPTIKYIYKSFLFNLWDTY